MANTKKACILMNTVSVDLGCGGGGCRKPKLIISAPNPKPQRKRPSSTTSSSSSTSSSASTTSCNYSSITPPTCNYSSDTDAGVKTPTTVRGFPRIGRDTVAVEKESDDPYLDFRRSMLRMILEKQIYSKRDLKDLLNCFLQLNSPYYHATIVRAFTEIWNAVYSIRPAADAAPSDDLHGMWASRYF